MMDSESWAWLRKGYLKKETEGLIVAAQDQALRTNWIKKNIDKQNISEKCRMCGQRDESVSHIVAECSKMAQSDYKARHDNVGRIVHLQLCLNQKLTEEKKWFSFHIISLFVQIQNIIKVMTLHTEH